VPYRYTRLDGDRYRLCVTFQKGWREEAASRRGDRRAISSQYGLDEEDRYIDLPDGPGEVCFEFTAVDFEDNADADE